MGRAGKMIRVHPDFADEVRDLSKSQKLSSSAVTRQIVWLLRSKKFKENNKGVADDVSPFFKF